MAAGAAAAKGPLQRRAAWDRANRTVYLALDYDDVAEAAARAGQTLPDLLHALWHAGATHLTVPLILVTGWWLGQVVDGVRWRALGVSGWLVLLGAMPLALLALGRGVLGLWGGRASLGGRSLEGLIASGNWLGALLVLGGAVYVIWRLGRPLGRGQLGRAAVLSGALVLAVLTARAAILACFINYDYATEYLVYAHSGPAVKTVMEEVDHIAAITNEGANMRIVFDDESSWPYTWYFRHYPNYGFLRGEAGSVDAGTLEGARIVVVGSKKVGDVRTILGDRYYEFGYIRLWWPMQEYFNLNYDRVAKVFSTDKANIAAPYYRQGLWDIWWDRDYRAYGQAMCIESKQFRCETEASLGTTDEERAAFRRSCEQAVVNECASDDRFAVNKWPVSDRMYFFVDKQIAAQVWDAGIGSSTVNIREPEYPEDRVYREITAERTLGEVAGMIGPRGIALDEDGTIYVADTDRSRVAVFSSQGEFLRSIGDPAIASPGGGLRQPWSLDVGPDGLVYVADTWNNRVAVFTQEGDFVRAWGHEGVPASDPSPEAMWGPRDLKIGPDGLVYVADCGGKVHCVDAETGQPYWVHDARGEIWALRDADDDQFMDVPFRAADGLDLPVALVVHEGSLYVSSVGGLVRLDDGDGDGVFEDQTVLVAGLSAATGYWPLVRWQGCQAAQEEGQLAPGTEKGAFPGSNVLQGLR